MYGAFDSRRRQGGEWGTDARDGDRTGVSERLSSTHPVTTSVRTARWKEGFVSMIKGNFERRQWFFFWVGGIGNGKRRHRGPWSSSDVHFTSRLQTDQNLCIYVLYFMSWSGQMLHGEHAETVDS